MISKVGLELSASFATDLMVGVSVLSTMLLQLPATLKLANPRGALHDVSPVINTSALVNHKGPASAVTSAASSITKPSGAGGKTKCIECDGYSCCCIPIPCTIMQKP
ncbi:hypothetical protein F503_06137 [Ophiostoma piceae UAMH 11346]|uniref:Uncharacterized protein n=1 Tax=Ophiostoma piceae (strain UAMH 11346) TaxID=1262450 RepID=S3C7G1_OPHP1|nr:hypothetical protein F503_06137 [Ophiostoma piceae UAMH 11346]